MIWYPLNTLVKAGVKEILLIVTEEYKTQYETIFGDGKAFNISIQYAIQNEPRGLAEAFIIAESFIGNDTVALILGDNIFYGQGFMQILKDAASLQKGGKVFAYKVRDPERYGVVDFDKSGKVLSIEEKPQKPKSNWAVTGLYFFDSRCVQFAKSLKPSARGELEITDLIRKYLEDGSLSVECFGRGFAWLDTGTHESLLEASQFIYTVENRQGLKISLPEEIAFRMGFITREQLRFLAEPLKKNGYGQYLLTIASSEE
jgi:glucose-1-phosphate thymidylyltransferase